MPSFCLNISCEHLVLILHAYADNSGFNVGRALARHFDGINAELQGI